MDRHGDNSPLGFLLGAAARKVAKFYAGAMAGQALTPSQLFFLRQLWREDGLQLRDLALRAQLDATSATWLVDQLEKAGLLERRRGDRDRRAVRIWLTPAGQALRGDLLPLVAEWEAVLDAALARYHTAAERQTFRAVLTTLILALPEGDDLWAQHSAEWDRKLGALQRLAEGQDPEVE
jgi:DNA-binding MarR family transcriptional regulator